MSIFERAAIEADIEEEEDAAEAAALEHEIAEQEMLAQVQAVSDPELVTAGMDIAGIQRVAQVWKTWQATTFHVDEAWRDRVGNPLGGRHGDGGGQNRDVYKRMNAARRGGRAAFVEWMRVEGAEFYRQKKMKSTVAKVKQALERVRGGRARGRGGGRGGGRGAAE